MDSENCNSVCMTVTICVAIIVISGLVVNGCRGYENRIRNYVEHGYSQKQCVGDRGVIWVKDVKEAKGE